MKPSMLRVPFRLAVLGAAMLVVACAGAVPPDTFLRASRAVQAAESDPDVRRHASVELERAREALSRARAAVREGADAERMDHLAYVAEQRGRIALAWGAARAAAAQVMQLGTERQRMRLDAEGERHAAIRRRPGLGGRLPSRNGV